jgi:pimeloyl-ACP methyl ester carboxylesterase
MNRRARSLPLIGWSRAGSGTVATSLAEVPPDPSERISVPTTVLWPDRDPLFPRAWSDRLDQFFSEATLRHLSGVADFVPLGAPEAFTAAIQQVLE